MAATRAPVTISPPGLPIQTLFLNMEGRLPFSAIRRLTLAPPYRVALMAEAVEKRAAIETAMNPARPRVGSAASASARSPDSWSWPILTVPRTVKATRTYRRIVIPTLRRIDLGRVRRGSRMSSAALVINPKPSYDRKTIAAATTMSMGPGHCPGPIREVSTPGAAATMKPARINTFAATMASSTRPTAFAPARLRTRKLTVTATARSGTAESCHSGGRRLAP